MVDVEMLFGSRAGEEFRYASYETREDSEDSEDSTETKSQKEI